MNLTHTGIIIMPSSHPGHATKGTSRVAWRRRGRTIIHYAKFEELVGYVALPPIVLDWGSKAPMEDAMSRDDDDETIL